MLGVFQKDCAPHKSQIYFFCSCIDAIYVSVVPSKLPESIYCTDRVPCNTVGTPRTRFEYVP